MQLTDRQGRLLAYATVVAVWLFAGTVGYRIGIDIGRAIFF